MISLDSVLIERTYAGVLAGCPTAKQVIAGDKRRLAQVFGDSRPVFVAPAKIDQYGRLPQWCCIAWLNGPIMNPDADGSHLFVIWYAGSLPNDLLSEAVKQIEGFQWEKLAADYWI